MRAGLTRAARRLTWSAILNGAALALSQYRPDRLRNRPASPSAGTPWPISAACFLGALYATTLLRRKSLWANDTPPFEPAAIWDFAFWAVIGIVVGGRIGYVLFYNLPYYAANPAEIIALWDGGM